MPVTLTDRVVQQVKPGSKRVEIPDAILRSGSARFTPRADIRRISVNIR